MPSSPGRSFMKLYIGSESALCGIAQDLVEPALGLAREHGDAHFPAGVELDRVPIQHRQAPRNVKSADGNGNSSRPERSGNVESAGILVRLNTDKRDKPEVAVAPEPGEQPPHIDARVRLVDHFDVDGDVRPKDLPLGAIGGDCIHGSERIRGDHRAPPADHVSVVVVVRRLDQNQLEASTCHYRGSHVGLLGGRQHIESRGPVLGLGHALTMRGSRL